jgi:hypothetical protein
MAIHLLDAGDGLLELASLGLAVEWGVLVATVE